MSVESVVEMVRCTIAAVNRFLKVTVTATETKLTLLGYVEEIASKTWTVMEFATLFWALAKGRILSVITVLITQLSRQPTGDVGLPETCVPSLLMMVPY